MFVTFLNIIYILLSFHYVVVKFIYVFRVFIVINVINVIQFNKPRQFYDQTFRCNLQGKKLFLIRLVYRRYPEIFHKSKLVFYRMQDHNYSKQCSDENPDDIVAMSRVTSFFSIKTLFLEVYVHN